jgi:drug/metabolite transporter (DMT)-like permease
MQQPVEQLAVGAERRVRVRRFGVIQTANTVAMLYLIIIGIIAVPVALIGLLVGVAGQPAGYSALLIILAPILYAIFGWLFAALACLIYNLSAGWIGGVEVTVIDAPSR